MSYTPNLNDPRIIKRINHALGFVRGCFSNTTPHAWSTRYIDKYLGQQNHNLGKFLRNHLITVTNSRYSKDSQTCKKYVLNLQGYEYIKDLVTYKEYMSIDNWKNTKDIKKHVELGDLLLYKDNYITYPSVSQVSDTTIISDWAKLEFQTEFDDLNFIYEDKSNRLWHPLQNVRKSYKQNIFRELGLIYQYDFVCCAPTLIHQYSHQIPLIMNNDEYVQGPMDLYLFSVQRYLQDRHSIRKQLANEAQIPEKLVKVIINALFAGAQLGNNPSSAIYKLLKGDKSRIEFLKQHPYIIELRSDIKTIWEYLRPTMTMKYKTRKSGKTRKIPLSSRDKWNLYFDLERQVLNIVRSYLDRTNNKYFLEHDGFTTQVEINQNELLNEIYQKTGFILQLDMETLLKNDNYITYPSVSQVTVSTKKGDKTNERNTI